MKLHTTKLPLLMFALLMIGSLSVSAQKIPFQGKLLENGTPVTGQRTFEFDIAAVSWTETHTNVQVTDGLYSVVLGSLTALPAGIFDGEDSRSLVVTVGGQALSPVEIYAPVPTTQIDAAVSAGGDQTAFEINQVVGSDVTNLTFGARINVSGSGMDGDQNGLYINVESNNRLYNTGLWSIAKGTGNGNLASENFGVFGEGKFNTNANYGVYGRSVGGLRSIGVYGSAAQGSEENWAGYFAGDTKITGDLTVDGNISGNINPNFTSLNVAENGASASISIANDPSQNDPTGYSAEMFLWGDESPNIQMGGQPWENGDLANLNLFGSNPEGTWYYGVMNMGAGRDGNTGEEWGALSISKNDGSTSTETINLDGLSGSGYFAGDLNVDGNINGNINPNFTSLNVAENGASASISIANDPSQNDPTGYSAEMFLWGDESPNIQMGGQPWENGDLANLNLYGSNAEGTWYYGVMNMGAGRDGNTGEEWGALSISKNDGSTSTETINLDGLSGNGYFAGDLNVDGNINGNFNFNGNINYGEVFLGVDPGDDYGQLKLYKSNDGNETFIVNANGNGVGNPGGAEMILRGDDFGDKIRLEANNNSGYINLSGMSGLTNASLISDWGSFGQGALILKDADGNDRGYFSVNDYEDNGTVYHSTLELQTNLHGGGARIDGNGWISVQQHSNYGNNAAEMYADGDVGVLNLNDINNQNAIQLNGGDGSGYFSGNLTVDGSLNGITDIGVNNATVGNFEQGVVLDNQSVNFYKGGAGNGGPLVVSMNSFDFGGTSYGSLQLYNGTLDGMNNPVNTETINLDGSNGNAVFSGSVTASSFPISSDRRLKADIQPIRQSLSQVLELQGVSYHWKDKSKDQRNQIGLIAQEVEEVYPEFVHTNEEGMKSVNYAQMVAVLIESIKELNAKITALETENASLKSSLAEVEGLKSQMKNLETLVAKLVGNETVTTTTQQQ